MNKIYIYIGMKAVFIYREEVSQHIAMVQSQDVSTVKQLVETVVWQIINGYDRNVSIVYVCHIY